MKFRFAFSAIHPSGIEKGTVRQRGSSLSFEKKTGRKKRSEPRLSPSKLNRPLAQLDSSYIEFRTLSPRRAAYSSRPRWASRIFFGPRSYQLETASVSTADTFLAFWSYVECTGRRKRGKRIRGCVRGAAA